MSETEVKVILIKKEPHRISVLRYLFQEPFSFARGIIQRTDITALRL